MADEKSNKDVKSSSEDESTSPSNDHNFTIPTLEITPYIPSTSIDSTNFLQAVPVSILPEEFFGEVNEYLVAGNFPLNFNDKIKFNTQRRKEYGFIKGSNFPIKFKLLPDFEITDNMTNDYAESFIQEKVNSLSSDSIRTIGQLNINNSNKKISEIAKKAANLAGDAIGAFAGSQGKKIATNVVNSAAGIISGGRKDMAHVWSGTSFQQSYPFSIILRCDQPNNLLQYTADIVRPLAILLNLATPRTSKTQIGQPASSIYKWPYIVQASILGCFRIKLGAITNIDITKTTEYGLASNQRPRAVKVTFNIVNLYHVLLGGDYGKKKNTDQNTITNYLAPFAKKFGDPYLDAGISIRDENGQLLTVEQQREKKRKELSAASQTDKAARKGNGGKKKNASVESNEKPKSEKTVKEPNNSENQIDGDVGDEVKAIQDAYEQRIADLLAEFNRSNNESNDLITELGVRIAILNQEILEAQQAGDVPLEALLTAKKVESENAALDLTTSSNALLTSRSAITEEFTSDAEGYKDRNENDNVEYNDLTSSYVQSVIDEAIAQEKLDKYNAAQAAKPIAQASQDNVDVIDGYLGKQAAFDFQTEINTFKEFKVVNENIAISSINKETATGNKILELSKGLIDSDNSINSITIISNSERNAHFERDYNSNTNIIDNNETALASRAKLIDSAQIQFDELYVTMNDDDKESSLNQFNTVDTNAIVANDALIADLPTSPASGSRDEALKNYYEADNVRRNARIVNNTALISGLSPTGNPSVSPTTEVYKRRVKDINYNVNKMENQFNSTSSSNEDIDTNDENINSIQVQLDAVVYPNPNDVLGNIDGSPITYTEMQELELPSDVF